MLAWLVASRTLLAREDSRELELLLLWVLVLSTPRELELQVLWAMELLMWMELVRLLLIHRDLVEGMMCQLVLTITLSSHPMATLSTALPSHPMEPLPTIIMDTLPMVAFTMEDIYPDLMEPTGSSVLLQLLEFLELPMHLPMDIDMHHNTNIKL